ncbi:MAG: PilT/PilU family type 4a pilus ATPase [Porticoccaceae bacterium]|nr:PilT/PilU family type 4a pilus ATPase [Porticoccaceae bacterium]
MDLSTYLQFMVDKQASDLFFSTGSKINIKIEGVTTPVNQEILAPGMTQKLAYSLLDEQQIQTFEKELEMNLAITVGDIGRFRVNVYKQRGDVAMVIRYIKSQIPTIEALNLPDILKKLAVEPRGLVLLVGSTGSGKSTTLAAMTDFRNASQTGHILAIEDPIEYIYQHKKSVVDQREVGLDTLSYANALKNAMREAPDVIVIGEIRDAETMHQAIAYAETGHLCLSTLHANNSYQAMERIVNFFPDHNHKQLLSDLALNVRAIVCQRLLTGIDGKRVPAVEVMLNTPYIASLIERGEFEAIRDAIVKNETEGAISFDSALLDLYESGHIAQQEALMNADSESNLHVKIRLLEGANYVGGDNEGFSMRDEEDDPTFRN